MAASVDAQCINVYISDSSQTQHLSAIIAAAGARKVNIYFTTAAGLVSSTNAGATGEIQDNDCKLSSIVDSEPDAQVPARVGFSDLPLELQINIFKFIFIRDTPQRFSVSRVRKMVGEGKTTKIFDYERAKLSAQLLRVSQVWNQYGSAMLLENTIQPSSANALANATSHAKNYNMPGLRRLKYLQLHAWSLSKTGLQRLRQYKYLQSVHLVDGYGFWAFNNGFEPGGPDPIFDCKSALLDYIDTRSDFIFRIDFKRSLQSVKYTFETYYWCSRMKITGKREHQKHKLKMEFKLSGETLSGIDVEVESDEVQQDWQEVEAP